MIVRRMLHALGYRFRLHRKDLPGKPDIVLQKHRTAIFVHGCFWHRHPGCKRASTPATNIEFWRNKFAANVSRDAKQIEVLESGRWRVLVVWECETKNPMALSDSLSRFLKQGECLGKKTLQ